MRDYSWSNVGAVGVAVLALVLALAACVKATPTPDYQRSLGGPGLTPTPTPTDTPTATPSPTATATPTVLMPLRPPILTEAQAIEVASRSAALPVPELSAGHGVRNPKARLMTLEEYEERFTQGRSYGDRTLPVWVVAVEGEWESAGIVPPSARKQYGHGVVVLNAHSGRGVSSAFMFEPIPLGDAEGLDPNSFSTYPVEVPLAYAREFVDFPVSEPGFLPQGFSLVRVTLELEHPLHDVLPDYYSWFPSQTVVQHYADGQGNDFWLAQLGGGLPKTVEGADQTTVQGATAWQSHDPGKSTWLAWTALCPSPRGNITHILYSAGGIISLDVLHQIAESLPKGEPLKPASTPMGVPTAVPTATSTGTPTATPTTTPVSLADLVKVWLEAASEVWLDGTVPLTLKVKNVTGQSLELWGSGAFYGFSVTRRSGAQVWLQWDTGANEGIQYHVKLQPSEAKEFRMLWGQIDSDGNSIPPGTYSVRGLFRPLKTEPPPNTWADRLDLKKRLETDPQQLTIKPIATPTVSPTPTPVQSCSAYHAHQHPAAKLSGGVRAPIQVQPGEIAHLKVVVGNFFEYPIEVPMRQPMYDFVVTRYDGTEVWRWSRGQTGQDIPTTLTLDSREERELTGDWDLVDDERNPVPDGMYLVNGFLKLDPPCEAGWGRKLMFVGPRLSLEHLVDIRMEVPSHVQSAEAVPLKLQVENITKDPLILYTGAMIYDFVVTDEDGEEVWRWSRGRVFPMFGVNVVLQPGEVKEYGERPWGQPSASYLSSNVPTSVWVEWEQCDMNCTPERIGIPCCGDPVPPGTYWAYGVLRAQLSDGFEGYGENTFESEAQEFTILP